MDHVNLFSRLPKAQKGAVGNQIWWIRTIIVIMTTLCVLALNYRQSEGAGGDCSSGHICLNLSLSFNSFFPVWVSGTRRHSRTSDLLWYCSISWSSPTRHHSSDHMKENITPHSTLFTRRQAGHQICYGKFSAKLAHSPSPCHCHTTKGILSILRDRQPFSF